MDRPDHRPDNNFADLVVSVRSKMCYGISRVNIHTNLVDLGLSSEEAHFLIRAAEIINGEDYVEPSVET